MKKKYMAPRMTVEQVVVNHSMLIGISGKTNGTMQGMDASDVGAKERNADVWSTDKENLNWDF